MITYYTLDENGKILETADWKFRDSCLETEREIVRGYDGQLYFAGEEPLPPPPTQEEFTAAVQAYMDNKVKERGYDDLKTATGYAGDIDPIFNAEGTACKNWRSIVWRTCYNILDKVTAGQREIPTVEELLAELPELVWPE